MSADDQAWRWLAEFAAHVRSRDLDAGAAMFDPACVSFGTRTERAADRSALIADQWTPIWLHTEEFAFDRASLVVQASADADQRVAIVTWTSVGIRADGTRFDRRGRATVVLRAVAGSSRLLATHTHFSESPDPA